MTRGSGFDGFGEALLAWVDKKVNGVDNALHDVARDVSVSGENITKHHIETRGTARSGKRGRHETGTMVNSVSSDSMQVARNHHRARFGWLQQVPFYARYQEPGFNHVGGFHVEGMYALTDAADEVIADAKEDLRRKLNDL